jgi:hypothetical protein
LPAYAHKPSSAAPGAAAQGSAPSVTH